MIAKIELEQIDLLVDQSFNASLAEYRQMATARETFEKTIEELNEQISKIDTPDFVPDSQLIDRIQELFSETLENLTSDAQPEATRQAWDEISEKFYLCAVPQDDLEALRNHSKNYRDLASVKLLLAQIEKANAQAYLGNDPRAGLDTLYQAHRNARELFGLKAKSVNSISAEIGIIAAKIIKS